MVRDRGPLLAIVTIVAMVSLLGPCCRTAGGFGEGDMPPDQMFWTEVYTTTGSCSAKPVQTMFHVNDTALSVVVNVTFHTNEMVPGADLSISGPDTYVIKVVTIWNRSHSLEIVELENRGKWSGRVSLTACGVLGAIGFTMNISVDNRYLGSVTADRTTAWTDDPVIFSASGLGLEQGESYRLDLGNDIVTDWKDEDIAVRWDAEGYYLVRTMVRTADGRTTGWSDYMEVEVQGEVERKALSTDGGVIALSLLMALLMLYAVVRRS